MTALIALMAALAPANPIAYVSAQHLGRARDRWLIGVLALGCIALARYDLWLSLMGAWFVGRWVGRGDHPSLITWIGIGASWALLKQIPTELYGYLPWGWVAVACWQVAWMLVNPRPHIPGTRPTLMERTRGTMGSPVLTGIFLALVSPFFPWWLSPVLAVGLYLSCSVHACLAVAIGGAWMAPWTLWITLPLLAGIAALWWAAPKMGGQRLIEWTPRGDSIDGWFSRLFVWRMVLRSMNGHWWLGHGPWSLEPAMRGWWTRYRVEVPSGEAHCEPMQHLYEYGLVGLVAGVAFLAPVLVYSRVGDPWSGAFIVGMVLSLGHWPWRHPAIGLTMLAIAQGVGR